jgi:hypothetical protein
MLVLKASWIMVISTSLALPVMGQTIHVIGEVKDANGTPLNGALVRVMDSQEHELGNGASNNLGRYSIMAKLSAATVTCEVSVGPDSAITYTPNPDREPITITSNVGKSTCTLYQVTKAPSYWHAVGALIGTKAGQGPDASKTYISAWKSINSSGLPPDSKAAAASQFKSMTWSHTIIDQTFNDYLRVDDSTLTKALHGDRNAQASLPLSVARDVKSYSMDKNL